MKIVKIYPEMYSLVDEGFSQETTLITGSMAQVFAVMFLKFRFDKEQVEEAFMSIEMNDHDIACFGTMNKTFMFSYKKEDAA